MERPQTANEEVVYQDGFQYKDSRLQFSPHAGGYVNVVQSAQRPIKLFSYVYQYKDHLGNNRVTFAKNPNGLGVEILLEDHYYPFGLKHRNYNMNRREVLAAESGGLEIADVSMEKHKYKYNGKEWQDELSLNWYDYHARNYDPALGRWMNIDPLAENSRRYSPYAYALNNPVFYIDPDGMEAQATNGMDTLDVDDFGDDCCPGTPFGGNAPKNSVPVSTGNITPSTQTAALMDEATEILSEVFSYDVGVSAGPAARVEGAVGNTKVGVDVVLIEGSVKTTSENIAEINVEGPGINADFSNQKVSGTAELKTGSAKVAMSKEGKIQTSTTGGGMSLSPKNINASISNQLIISGAVKIPVAGVSVRVGGSVNLTQMATGINKFAQAGVSWFSDIVSNMYSSN